MKIVLCVLVLLVFSVVAYLYKKHYENQSETIKEIIDYIEFYDNNISLNKENLIEINNKFNIMQKNKNAKHLTFSLKNNMLCVNNIKNLQIIDNEKINNYFNSMGVSEYIFEKEKNKAELEYLYVLHKISKDEIKTKGELGLKIIMAIGAIIAILIW